MGVKDPQDVSQVARVIKQRLQLLEQGCWFEALESAAADARRAFDRASERRVHAATEDSEDLQKKQ